VSSAADSSANQRAWARGQAALEDALRQCAAARAEAEAQGLQDEGVLLNATLYAILFNYDLRQLLHDVETTRGTWGGKLYARVLALTLYECSKDFQSLLAKNFQRVVERFATDGDVAMLRSLHSRVCEFYNRNRVFLVEIRTESMGHRHTDASIQMARIETLPIADVERLGVQLLLWLNEFLSFNTAVYRSLIEKNRRKVAAAAAAAQPFNAADVPPLHEMLELLRTHAGFREYDAHAGPLAGTPLAGASGIRLSVVQPNPLSPEVRLLPSGPDEHPAFDPALYPVMQGHYELKPESETWRWTAYPGWTMEHRARLAELREVSKWASRMKALFAQIRSAVEGARDDQTDRPPST
jgi:hypothetical protein